MVANRQLRRSVSVAKHISLAYPFNLLLAVQRSNLDPLPHQIEAVYEMLVRAASLRAGRSFAVPMKLRVLN